MNRGKIIAASAGLAVVCALTACEDKALAAKISAQKSQIEALDADIEAQKHLLGKKPEGNPEGDLDAAKKSLAETEGQVRDLEAQIEELKNAREEIAKEFEAYKQKYKVEN